MSRRLGASLTSLGLLCLSAGVPSCYTAWGLGVDYPTGRSRSRAGGDVAMDVGLVFDYRRVVRVAYARSFQMLGGAAFTADGQVVIVPLPNVVEVQVTAHRFPEEVYLRGMARAYWGSPVLVGPMDHEIAEAGSSAYGGMLGATLLFAGDHEQIGPTALSLTAGVMVARAETESLGRLSFVTPMLLLGADFFPPLLLYCWFDEKCPHHLKL
jgi:hypothetical protein